MSEKVIVVGVGEVGQPLLELIKDHHEVHGVDIGTTAGIPRCDIMHICFGYEDDDFIQHSLKYIETYRPSLTIIESTVAPGTTRKIATASGTPAVHSPVLGKHSKMKQEMLHYTKFVGAIEKQAGERACRHFESIGMRTKLVSSPEVSELSKLTETTYFGVLIAWAQEVERYCEKFGANYDEVVTFYEQIAFFPPVKYTPGLIGGHCVMPNIKILKGILDSGILDAIERSNEMKRDKLGVESWAK